MYVFIEIYLYYPDFLIPIYYVVYTYYVNLFVCLRVMDYFLMIKRCQIIFL